MISFYVFAKLLHFRDIRKYFLQKIINKQIFYLMATLKFNRTDNSKVEIYFVIGRTPEGKFMLDYCEQTDTIGQAEKMIRDAFENNGNMMWNEYHIFINNKAVYGYIYTDKGIEVRAL